MQVENQRGSIPRAAEAALASAQAAAEQARLAFESQIDGVNTTVARLQAELREAEYDLASTAFTGRRPTGT